MIIGTVIGHDIDRIFNTLIVDVGTRDNVKKNMTVITAEGLVGKVFESYGSSCSVQIIKDLRSRVSADAGGIRGIVRWEGGKYLQMYGLPLSTIPRTGVKVYSTGIGGVFPTGILIGTIEKQIFDDVELFASVNIEPAVDFSAIQEVFIMKGAERSDVWDDGQGTGHFKRPETE